MAWVRVQFKGKKVWAEVNSAGMITVKDGRVPIRYSKRAGAKIYSGGAERVQRISGAEPEELPDGVSADSKGGSKKRRRKKKRGSGFGKAGTRSAAQAAAARADAREQIDALPDSTHLAFTDGACQGNPGPAGAGAVVKLVDGRTLEASRSCGIATNNVGELTAVGMALELLEEADVDPEDHVVLFTDSKYVLGVLTKGWKAKANRKLILGLRDQLSERPGLEVRWVAGHVGIPENERADALAVAGAQQARR